MASKGTADGIIQSGQRLLAVVDALKDLDGATVTELAAHLDVPPSTAHRHLKTLREEGYVTQDGDTYRLGLKFLDVGGYVRAQSGIARAIKPTIKELVDESGEISAFIMEDDGLGVFVHRRKSDRGVHSDARVGKRVPLHLTSGGKAILAHLPEARVEEILDRHGLPGKTRQSITDRETLFEQLEATRERGYAFGRGENTEGLYSVGVPVRPSNERVLGAVTVAGPAHRMEGDRMKVEIPDLLLEKINEFVLNFSYS